jgi:hypothetical protein
MGSSLGSTGTQDQPRYECEPSDNIEEYVHCMMRRFNKLGNRYWNAYHAYTGTDTNK